MRIAQEEIFGPVLSVLSYDDEEEALSIANGTRYGLVACGVDPGRRQGRAAGAADRGRSGLDQHAVVGRRHRRAVGRLQVSGFGRTVSADSILDYTQVKSVIIDGRRA